MIKTQPASSDSGLTLWLLINLISSPISLHSIVELRKSGKFGHPDFFRNSGVFGCLAGSFPHQKRLKNIKQHWNKL